MARPQKEGLDYFPHDTDASNDEKIEALRALYGNDGYAFYFISLERIYRSPNCELNISASETRQIYANKVGVSLEKYEQILVTALQWGCFDKAAYEERGVLTSNGIKKRASVVFDKREKMQRKYKEKVSDIVSASEMGEETSKNGGFLPSFCEVSVSRESKVKESKDIDKDIDNINNARTREDNKICFANNVFLTGDEYKTLCIKTSTSTPGQPSTSTIKITHYICALSKKKTNDMFKPPGSDYEELLRMINEGDENV